MESARLLRDLVFAALTSRRTYVEVEGVKLSLEGASPRMRYVMFRGYEAPAARLAMSVLAPDDRVLEIGAGTGFMAIVCSRRTGVQHYRMVEASPSMLPVIRGNFALNGASMPELVHAAVCERDGPLVFHVHRNFWSSSIIRREGSRPVSVEGRSIPSLLREIPWTPTTLILDVEGCEADIPTSHFQPFRKLIMEIHPALIGDGRAADLLAGLTSAGFREVGREGWSYAFERG